MDRLTAIVLGAAAGGGFPQWNCRCAVCRLAWERDPRVKPRTQASLAVSADRQNWVLLNASPDLRAQIQAVPALQPHTTPRGSPIAGVILTGAEVDQVGGLLTLRERGKLTLYGTGDTLAAVANNPIFGVLAADIVDRQAVTLAQSFVLPNGLEAEVFSVPGKVALYLEKGEPEGRYWRQCGSGDQKRRDAPCLCAGSGRDDREFDEASRPRRCRAVRWHALS